MTTACYALVRGSSLRVTSLTPRGSVLSPVRYATSKSVAKVTVNEVSESSSSEMLGSAENDNDRRIRIQRPSVTIRYTVDIDFIRVDPGVLSLLTNVGLTKFDPSPGFGSGAFGEMEFGAPEEHSQGFGGDDFGVIPFGAQGEDAPVADRVVVGFDAMTRKVPVSFGMEVWSRLAGAACEGERQYGYTLFPHLRGGYLTGFAFNNGLVSFSVRGAQTRRGPRWHVGPHDLDGSHQRLVEPVSRNTIFRQTLTTAPPPAEMCGVQERDDVIRGGSATVTSDDVIDGGDATTTSPWIIYGGRAV